MKNKLLAFGSFFCPIYIILIIIVIIAMSFSVDMEAEIPVHLRPVVAVCLILLLFSVIGTWFFIIFDIVHTAKNQSLSGGAKAGWICAIWFLNIFIIPIFWFKFLRKNHRTSELIKKI